MPTAENAKIQYEGGQTSYAMAALTNSGDATTFTGAAAPWSRYSGFQPVIRPNGLLTGGALGVSATNNEVTVAALTCNLNGVVTSVNAGAATITRPATAVSKVCSVTINNSGAIAIVAGTDGATTAFSETRGAAGGPPLIPTTSIEIGQVRVTSNTAAALTTSQLFATPSVHVEMATYPSYTVNYRTGAVTFIGALPLIHTGTVPKAVFASYATPIFADVPFGADFVPPETTHSVTSTQVYGGTLGSTASTLNQGSFTAYLDDGVTDPLVGQKNQILWFKHYPDRTKTPYIICQGKLGIARTFPAGDAIQAACTISAESAGNEVS
jgi:hypothetical protein